MLLNAFNFTYIFTAHTEKYVKPGIYKIKTANIYVLN